MHTSLSTFDSKTYDYFVFDYSRCIVHGYKDINRSQSASILRTAKLGTYIIRPSSEIGSYTMDVRGDDKVFSYRLSKNNNEYSLGDMKANCLTDLISEIKRKGLPDSKLFGTDLIPYIDS